MLARQPAWAHVLLAATWLLAASSEASPRAYIKSICLDPERLEAQWIESFRVPVGCELIDCCPGCPAARALDWRVRVGGESVEAATLAFEGLADPDALRVEGAAELTPEGVVLTGGKARLRNLTLPDTRRPPMADLRLRLDAEYLRRLAAAREGAGGGDVVEIAIEQMLGPVAVNEFLLRYRLEACGMLEPCDVVKQQGNTGSDRSVVLLDGRSSSDACVNDLLRRGTDTTAVGSFKTKGSCTHSEVAIFSQDDAMALLVDPPWSDACGDEVLAELEAAWKVDVNLWLGKLFGGHDPDSVATHDMLEANALYSANKTGIAFGEQQRKPLPTDLGTIAKIVLACQGIGGLENTGLYVKDQLNVYYGPVTFTGQSCKDRNMVLMGPFQNDTTLGHEFGHALSLHGGEAEWGHSNDVPGMTPANIMWVDGSQPRTHVSLGQAFRFNVNKKSQLNRNGPRNGPERECPPKRPPDTVLPDYECPDLMLDWSRP